MPELLLATGNEGKVREFRQLLRGLPFTVVAPAELGLAIRVDEVGSTLEDNARLKATAFAQQGQRLVLADDSGLEVDALGGEPGPLSARCAGEGARDEDRYRYLLARLEGVPWAQRTARFRCVIAIATPGGEVDLCHGECRGLIALEPKGGEGFGYDPVFFLPELGKTMAELPPEVKNRLSHRGQAAQMAINVLRSKYI